MQGNHLSIYLKTSCMVIKKKRIIHHLQKINISIGRVSKVLGIPLDENLILKYIYITLIR